MTARAETSKSHIKRSFGDKMISVVTYFVYAIFAFVCVYPFYYLIINSISANNLSERGKVLFYPMQIHFTNYTNLAQIPGLTDAALMSVLRTVVGTILTVIIAAFLGYMFTRKTLWRRKLWYRFVVITMYFNAGIIPWYLAMKTLGMTNNFWGYIFPTVVQPFYIILCKTYCESVPQALQDAAEIEGAGTLRIFFSIMLPVIKPILATIAIFAAVNQWNAFQDTLLLMRDQKLYTLQFFSVPIYKPGQQSEICHQQYIDIFEHCRGPGDSSNRNIYSYDRHSGCGSARHDGVSLLPEVLYKGHHDRSGKGMR